MKPIWDFGIEHVVRSNCGITMGRLRFFSSSVCNTKYILIQKMNNVSREGERMDSESGMRDKERRGIGYGIKKEKEWVK